MKVLREARAFCWMLGDKSMVLLVFPAKVGNTNQSFKWSSGYITTQLRQRDRPLIQDDPPLWGLLAEIL